MVGCSTLREGYVFGFSEKGGNSPRSLIYNSCVTDLIHASASTPPISETFVDWLSRLMRCSKGALSRGWEEETKIRIGYLPGMSLRLMMTLVGSKELNQLAVRIIIVHQRLDLSERIERERMYRHLQIKTQQRHYRKKSVPKCTESQTLIRHSP